MIEEYLNQRLELLNDNKREMKDDLIEIRSSLHETKRELDEYMSSTSRPFEPFSPRRDAKDDERLQLMGDKIKELNKQFESISSSISSLEAEIDVVKQCIDEYHSDHTNHNF